MSRYECRMVVLNEFMLPYDTWGTPRTTVVWRTGGTRVHVLVLYSTLYEYPHTGAGCVGIPTQFVASRGRRVRFLPLSGGLHRLQALWRAADR